MASQTAASPESSTPTTTTPASPTRAAQARAWGAATLIGIGAGALAIRALGVTPAGAPVIVLVVGAALLIAHLVTRAYAPLVAGSILSGLGAGLVATQQLAIAGTTDSGLATLGLGLGFLAIWVIGGLLRLARHHWWPLIPGGILVAIGGSMLAGVQGVDVQAAWPLVLVVIGILVLVGTRTASRTAA